MGQQTWDPLRLVRPSPILVTMHGALLGNSSESKPAGWRYIYDKALQGSCDMRSLSTSAKRQQPRSGSSAPIASAVLSASSCSVHRDDKIPMMLLQYLALRNELRKVLMGGRCCTQTPQMEF